MKHDKEVFEEFGDNGFFAALERTQSVILLLDCGRFNGNALVKSEESVIPAGMFVESLVSSEEWEEIYKFDRLKTQNQKMAEKLIEILNTGNIVNRRVADRKNPPIEQSMHGQPHTHFFKNRGFDV